MEISAVIVSIGLIILAVYVFISERNLNRQFEREKARAEHLDSIVSEELLLACLVIETGELDLYDPEVQSILRRLIAAQTRYTEMYGVDWTASIEKKIKLLRDI